MFLSTDRVSYICLAPFAADPLSKKYTFARSIDQKPTNKKSTNLKKKLILSGSLHVTYRYPKTGKVIIYR